MSLEADIAAAPSSSRSRYSSATASLAPPSRPGATSGSASSASGGGDAAAPQCALTPFEREEGFRIACGAFVKV